MQRNELAVILMGFENVCFSGGAAGADRLFGLWASANGQDEIHFSFAAHKAHVDESTVVELPNELLTCKEVQDQLKLANRTLGRSVPRFGYVYNLLARNSYQIYCTERVYTIGELVSPSQLDGGTAWAVQMYLDRDNEDKEIYHYDIMDNKVYQYCNQTKQFIEVESVPKPHGKWTGIGTRRATQEHMDNFASKFE
jgi:hypothetical protein